MSPMKIFIISFFCALKAFSLDYGYPYHDPYLASLTSALYQLKRNDHSKLVKIPGIESRKKVPFLEGRNFTRVRFFQQSHTAPLVFIVTGTGSHSSAGYAYSQAQELFDLGYHVAILTSTMHWSFILAENKTGIAGYTPEDSIDLYNYMSKVITLLKQKYAIQISGYSAIGYSLGAAELGFISIIDQREHQFNFDKIVMVNPPLDLHYAIQVLDQLPLVAAGWSKEQINYVQSLVYTVGLDFVTRQSADPKYFYDFDKTPFAQKDYAKFLIGASFRSTLADDIFVLEQIHDTGLLKSPIARYSWDARESEARTISFQKYAEEVILPRTSQRLGMAVEDVYHTASLRSLLPEISKNPHIRILHNADDFLTSAQDLKNFQEAFGDRMTVFPFGGHLGNLWYPENIAVFCDIFR